MDVTAKNRHERRKYLYALAIVFDIDPSVARERIDELMSKKTMLSHFEYKKDRDDQSPMNANIVRGIGRDFFRESYKRIGLEFTLGCRILSLLEEDPESKYFTELHDWVNQWTGEGQKFKRALEEYEVRTGGQIA